MPHPHLLIDDAVRILKQHLGWTLPRLSRRLQNRHGLSTSRADAIARRAFFTLDCEAQRSYRPRRRTVLTGDTSGTFDNMVRIMEDFDTS